jgi:5-methylcytosine-specific restriction endonuclease McrA
LAIKLPLMTEKTLFQKIAEAHPRTENFGSGEDGACELCGRFVRELTRHHLVPRSRHKKKRAKKAFDRREIENCIALLCRPCHRNVHAVLDNRELEREYNTVEALASHPGVERFTRWIENKPHGTVVPDGRENA